MYYVKVDPVHWWTAREDRQPPLTGRRAVRRNVKWEEPPKNGALKPYSHDRVPERSTSARATGGCCSARDARRDAQSPRMVLVARLARFLADSCSLVTTSLPNHLVPTDTMITFSLPPSASTTCPELVKVTASLAKSKRTVCLVGAGISTSAGIQVTFSVASEPDGWPDSVAIYRTSARRPVSTRRRARSLPFPESRPRTSPQPSTRPPRPARCTGA